MKSVAILLFIGVCGVVYCRPEEKYTTKYDNIDLDAIIKNDRLLRNYIDCVLGTKKCTKDGEELKRHLPEAIQTDCAKCSEAQRNGSRKIIRHLVKNKPSWWKELQTKFDPQGTYVAKHAEDFRKEGITV
nr:chemosensory protein 6 [Pachyrhinus yasumatsui]